MLTRCNVLGIMLAFALLVVGSGVANADMDLTTATWDMSSVGWGLGGNLALDDNLTTRTSSGPHNLPPDPLATSTNEWLWVDLGSDVTLSSVSIDYQISAADDYTIRLLTAAEGTALSLTDDGTAGGGVGLWTVIATATGLPDALDLDGEGGGARGVAGAADVWDFVGGTATIPSGVGTGSATVNVTDPIGRYLLIDGTLVSDPGWGNISIWELDVVPEPATLALLGMGSLALLRRRRR